MRGASIAVGRQNRSGRYERPTFPCWYKNGFMLGLIWGVFTWLRSFIRFRHDLGLEIVALRQQLLVLKRRTKRAHLRRSDRLFWVVLRRAWSQWAKPLLIVKPDTVVRWHRKGFRLYWRVRSRSKQAGRPITGHEARVSLSTLANENPTWGPPHTPHPWGAVEARIRDFRANSLALPVAVASPRRDCSALASFSEESQGSDCGDGLVHRDYGQLPDSVLLFLIRHDRREIIHLNVTEHPTGEWTVQQLREAFPESTDDQ